MSLWSTIRQLLSRRVASESKPVGYTDGVPDGFTDRNGKYWPRGRYQDRIDPTAPVPDGKVIQFVTDHMGRRFALYRDYDPEDGKWT